MTTRIIGTGSYVPEQIVTNGDLAKIVETSGGWIRSRTGISTRRIAIADSTSHMAACAAQKVLKQSGVKPEEIDLILLGTSSPDYYFPNGAREVQSTIEAANAVCYDISTACTGFVFALNTAHAFISSGLSEIALVIGSDVLSKLTDWTDRNTCVLFGDGAGAVVVKADSTGVLGTNMHSDDTKGGVFTYGSGTDGNFLMGKKPELGYMTMDGQEVFKFAVKKIPECIRQVLDDSGVAAEQVKYFVIHRADHRIIESIAKRLKVSVDRFPVNMEYYGSTPGASVPLLLGEINRRGMLEAGDKIVFSGFGVGLTWGVTLLEW